MKFVRILSVTFALHALFCPSINAQSDLSRSLAKLRQCARGMLNYESAYSSLPRQNLNGLSWRVHILPHIGHKELYKRFEIFEPWDSPNNIKLISKMPITYAYPGQPASDIEKGLTVYQVPYMDLDFAELRKAAPKVRSKILKSSPAFHSDPDGPKYNFNYLADGTSHTILVIEVNTDKAVVWTKPDDWVYDEKDPLRDLCNFHRNGFAAAFANASAHLVDKKLDKATLQDLFSRASGNGHDYKYFERRKKKLKARKNKVNGG